MAKITDLTQDQAAALLGVTTRRLRQKESEDNPPPRSTEGGYPCIKYGEWLRRRDDLDITVERARVAKEQADKLEMENAVRRGELIEREDVDRGLGEVAMRVRARLLSLPSKAAPMVAGRAAQECETVLTTVANEALTEIAGYADCYR